MAQKTTGETFDILQVVHYLPSVSIILPLTADISLKTEMQRRLKLALDHAEKELTKNYTGERYGPVMDKLQKLAGTIDFKTSSESIALFASPLFSKLYYLDVPVAEKIIIDESFEIRDLVYEKSMTHQYLVVLLSGEQTRFFLGNGPKLLQVSTGIPEHVAAYKNDIPERISNFSDPSYRKEVLLNKLLRQTDKALTLLLKLYPFKVFVIGTEKTNGYFKKFSHNTSHIAAYIQGNYESATEAEIYKALQPQIADLNLQRWRDIYSRLDDAMSKKKLATGIASVWKAAMQQNGRLLVVERNYMYPARLGANGYEIYEPEAVKGSDLFIKDAVDDIIEMILKNGGEVEFVDEGLLNKYTHIALVEYY